MSKRTLVRMESKRNAEEDAYLYWLCMLGGIGKKKRDALLTVAGNAKAVYELKEELIDELVFLSSADKEAIKTAKKQDVHSAYAMLKEQGVRFVMQHHKEYPGRLLHIPDAPFGLFVRGSLPKEELPCVAVIGARDCTEYGRYVALELGRRLAEAGIQVVSGMARGIDSIAQSACAGAGGEVYGVLGCGVDICYPKESRHLYERLLQKGGILSEYPMGTQPRSQLFPRRNRIISGLSDAVVVVEAREKSGTLITVDMALEQGREVY
ncbi:MAG: DNA-processing protein DprA, partial [Lachnospiraceae bacterium]|nr:DNA-processing protein DprA [Lachnospiraceae bacterium]